MGRFINADAFASTGQGLKGYNSFTYCFNSPVSNYDVSGRYAICISFGADITLGFFAVSMSYGVAIDDDGNIAIQSSYSLPNYIDSQTYNTGLFDAGLGVSLQVTNDDTVFNLEGPACYSGLSASAGPYYGVDLVFSGAKAMDTKYADALPNGAAFVVGYGFGIDTHFRQTNTETLFSVKIPEIARRLIEWM